MGRRRVEHRPTFLQAEAERVIGVPISRDFWVAILETSLALELGRGAALETIVRTALAEMREPGWRLDPLAPISTRLAAGEPRRPV